MLGLAESDSPRFNTLYATNGNFDGNLLVGGTITARTYVVSSSVVNIQTLYASGSSKFGDTLDDTHQFTGSLSVTGSTIFDADTMAFTGSAYISGSLNVEGKFVLPTTNQLPVLDTTGSLVISGSNLYLFI